MKHQLPSRGLFCLFYLKRLVVFRKFLLPCEFVTCVWSLRVWSPLLCYSINRVKRVDEFTTRNISIHVGNWPYSNLYFVLRYDKPEWSWFFGSSRFLEVYSPTGGREQCSRRHHSWLKIGNLTTTSHALCSSGIRYAKIVLYHLTGWSVLLFEFLLNNHRLLVLPALTTSAMYE